ncbi:uncharacterized protein SCHCODRAFT_02682791 [Schizophyllum commune H4-8]|nr:uncharacterized protein SCHCODRAFT_02682791 [Schizophyllum commune H4-8]KAI5899841.1 hypothetical protein SCHCODRAFT_02682791 [Schizophyllum commune H4-8]
MAAKCCDSPVIVTEYGSSVACCTNCGEVVETVFLSNEEPYSDTYTGHSRAGLPLKSFRNDGRVLAGQDTELRRYKLRTELYTYIKQFTVEMGCPGLNERVCNLFDQAMASGQFTWGSKAIFVAGAALILAQREANRWESIHDIAYLLQKVQGFNTASLTSTNLGRTLNAVKHALNIEHKFQDHGELLDAVQKRLRTGADDNSSDRPPSACIKLLANANLDVVANIARTLHSQLGRLPWSHELRVLSFPATACVIAILALEAEQRAIMPKYAEFAGWLGVKHGVKKGTIQERGRILQDLALEWIGEISWLQQYDPKAKKSSGKRLVIARGLKDALEHQEKVWKERVDTNIASRLASPVDEQPEAETSPCPAACTGKRKRQDECATRPKRRPLPASVSAAAQFLLDPTAAPAPRRRRRTPATATSDAGHSETSAMLPTAAHLLSSHAALGPAPTRLQKLVAVRGGADRVTDDELFEEDEFASMFRSEADVKKLSDMVIDIWIAEEAIRAEKAEARQRSRQKRKKRAEGEESERIDKDALEKFFDDDDEKDGEEEDERGEGGWFDDLKALSPESDPGFGTAVGLGVGLGMRVDDKGNDPDAEKGDDEYELARKELMRMHAGSDAMVVGDWRAASPSGWGGGDDYF